MHLEYVDKLAKDNNGVTYLLVRRIPKRINPRQFGSKREQKLSESLKNIAKLMKYKITLQRVRLRLHWLNVQCDPREKNFTVTWKLMLWRQLHSQNKPIRPNTEVQRKTA